MRGGKMHFLMIRPYHHFVQWRRWLEISGAVRVRWARLGIADLCKP